MSIVLYIPSLILERYILNVINIISLLAFCGGGGGGGGGDIYVHRTTFIKFLV